MAAKIGIFEERPSPIANSQESNSGPGIRQPLPLYSVMVVSLSSLTLGHRRSVLAALIIIS